MQESECNVAGDCRGMQRNSTERNESRSKVPGESRGMQRNRRGMKGTSAKRQGNAMEWQEMPRERTEWVQSAVRTVQCRFIQCISALWPSRIMPCARCIAAYFRKH